MIGKRTSAIMAERDRLRRVIEESEHGAGCAYMESVREGAFPANRCNCHKSRLKEWAMKRNPKPEIPRT